MSGTSPGGPDEFGEDLFADDELVFSKSDLKKVRADSPGRDGGRQDVGVEVPSRHVAEHFLVPMPATVLGGAGIPIHLRWMGSLVISDALYGLPIKVKKVARFGLAVVAAIVGLPLLFMIGAIGTISVLDKSTGSIVSSGDRREYILHVPGSYDPAEPTPLVISLHAGATWPAHQKNLSNWNRLADERGFMVVYPAGTPQFLGVARMWGSFDPGRSARDVQFIADLLDRLEGEYNIDRRRIYANGMSNGGGMAFVLACQLSARIAAVGLIAPAQSLPADWCASARPVPAMVFHGDQDPIVPYEGGPLGDPFNPVRPTFPPIRDFVGSWASRNGCHPAAKESMPASDVRRLEYESCAGNAQVVLYTLVGGGHSWPGGKPGPKWRVGSTNMSISATSELWTFFSRHQLQ